jgi:hypothetical protein
MVPPSRFFLPLRSSPSHHAAKRQFRGRASMLTYFMSALAVLALLYVMNGV